MLTKIYWFLWFHTQMWIRDKSKRRPYTFILRDFYHENPLLTILSIRSISYAAGRWWVPLSTKDFGLGLISLLAGIVLGHLFWGRPWKEGEQEYPEYNPEDYKNG